MSPTQTFQQHVLELRHRVYWIFLAIVASGIIGYNLRLGIIRIISKPLGAPLYYNNPAGSFNFEIKVSLIVSLFIALPVIVYQLLRFVQPALPRKVSKKLVASVITSSFLLASIGIAFGYYVIVPLSLHFFARFSTEQLKPLISSDSYLSYLVNNLIVFAIVFQLPLLIYFINRIKPLKPKKLLHYQRYVIVGAFILALVLPFTYDPISQFVIALPVILLYYLSIIIVWISNKNKLVPANYAKSYDENLFADIETIQQTQKETSKPKTIVVKIAPNTEERKSNPKTIPIVYIDSSETVSNQETNQTDKSSSNYHSRLVQIQRKFSKFEHLDNSSLANN